MRRLISGINEINRDMYDVVGHDLWEIIVNLEGNGNMELNGKIFPFKKGTVVCIPPGVPHNKIISNGAEDIWLQYEPTFISKSENPIIIEDDVDFTIATLMKMLHRFVYKKDYDEVIVNSLLEFMELFIMGRANLKPTDKRVEYIKNEISNQFQSPYFSPENVLKDSGYSPDYIRKLFKENTGKTPHEYLTDLRLRSAKRMLSHREFFGHSVANIAYLSGFEDEAYFGRIFKRNTGLTPLEYAEKYKVGNVKK